MSLSLTSSLNLIRSFQFTPRLVSVLVMTLQKNDITTTPPPDNDIHSLTSLGSSPHQNPILTRAKCHDLFGVFLIHQRRPSLYHQDPLINYHKFRDRLLIGNWACFSLLQKEANLFPCEHCPSHSCLLLLSARALWEQRSYSTQYRLLHFKSFPLYTPHKTTAL